MALMQSRVRNLEAVLVMDPGREDVVFDTVLEIASGEYDVHDADTSAAG